MMLSSKSNHHLAQPLVVGLLGGSSDTQNHLAKLCPANLAILELTESQLEAQALPTCDAIIGVLDGDLGVGPELITAWAEAIDHDISRIVLAINTVQGRADFDEAIALSELVLNEDIAIRYYPIEDDEEPKYVGLLDVLTNEIVQPGTEPVPADAEHINLTLDDHEELVELLVHADLSDGLFESHTSGMPISLPRLRELWDKVDLVTVLPIDQQVSDSQIVSWLSSRTLKWLPTVTQADETLDISHSDVPLGIGIAPGIARMWNFETKQELELSTLTTEVLQLTGVQAQILLFDSRIQPGDTIRPINTNYLVTAPSV